MGLYKRDTVWWMTFSFKGNQVRRSAETTDRKLAEKIYAKVLTQVTEGKWFDKPLHEDKTLSDLFERYINEYTVMNKAERTIRQDRGFAKNMLEFFGDALLSEITPNRISSYKAHLRAKGLSAATINMQRGVLSHVFKKAVREWEWVKENPVEKVSRERIRNARDRWLTIEEANKLLNACVIYATGRGNIKVPHYWLQEIVFFDLNTGMRMDEVLSLEWPHVDLFRKTVTVIRSKNGEKRTIPLNQKAFELLKTKTKARDILSKYVFASEVGTKINSGNLRRSFYNALERAEITDFRFHDLRHTFATRLAQAGVDLYKIAKLLGHKDIKMTQRYSHHYPESLRDGVEVLDKIITILSQSNEKGLRQMP